ncbi:tRNA (cmo5U34)-methyltransferase [Dysgonomonas alginatilytica]|uniref:tRNA (Cmo5U34)-methyltransferase n=1 Tax=Dysgonomonas alginatilytica TaxID=1605892 RepID=A0A2V3PKV7_9BACT|nr:class I SAM-dependent methyltransferase [Dysgonomonas alginatilytica]PXV60046.1 tRNA (cmo5U34)-methyltransferase [Dysgonomonas alginatilytica]
MTVESQFNSIARLYDRQRPSLIPCFSDFYGVAIDNLNVSTPSPEILDLGAGTGLFSQFVLQKFPDAKITLVDISEKMLDIARKRFSSNENISIIQADFTTFKGEKQYDAVISSLAIHHLEDNAKVELYNTIFKLLKPNCIFINAEQVAGESDYFSRLYDKEWREKVETSDLTRDEIDASYERIKLDKRTPVSTQLQWLRNAGFKEVDCLYKYYDFAVLYCQK